MTPAPTQTPARKPFLGGMLDFALGRRATSHVTLMANKPMKAMKAMTAMKAMKAMKAIKAMKAMKAMKKKKRVSKIAKGKFRKVLVLRGTKAKTMGGLKKSDLMKTKS